MMKKDVGFSVFLPSIGVHLETHIIIFKVLQQSIRSFTVKSVQLLCDNSKQLSQYLNGCSCLSVVADSQSAALRDQTSVCHRVSAPSEGVIPV